MKAGSNVSMGRAMRKAAVAALAAVLVLTSLALGAETALSARTAQSGTPVFESADYDIKDGTSPAIADGVAYLFAGEDPYSLPGVDSSIIALDASNGGLLWQKGLEWAGGKSSKAKPLVDGDLLYIGCGRSVYCLDTTRNGKILWHTDITPAGGLLGDSVIISDPVMYSDGSGKKVVVVGDFTYGSYVGVDATTGAVKWEYALDANSSASGAPGVDDAGDRLYLPQSTAYGYSTNGKLHCIDVSGAVPAKKWEYAAAYDLAGPIACYQGEVFFSDFAYGGPISNFYCLEDGGDHASPVWSQPIWGSSGTPLLDANRNTVYVCGNDYSVGGNHFYAFDMDSGDLVWDNPNWGAYNGNCALSPDTGYLYAGSFDTMMWAHNLGMAAMDPGTGSELWYVQQKAGGDPVVRDGLVYSTADGRLYAYEEFKPSAYDSFFAEGCTAPGFEEFLCLANPGGVDATVSVTYCFNGDRGPESVDYPVPAGTRTTVNVNEAVGEGQEVSLEVVSDQPVVAERPMYFDYQGIKGNGWSGGHCVVGTDAPKDAWFFAEGCTAPGFEEWLCLGNFEDQPAQVTVDYLYSDGEPKHETYTVPGNRRVTLSVNEEAGYGEDVSIEVNSDRPIVAERPMYFSYGGKWDGGHCVMGTEQAGRQWLFAEGFTGTGFEEYLCLANPGDGDAGVTVTYVYQGEEAVTKSYGLPANSRQTLNINREAGSGKEVGLVVSSDSPILAERPMYFEYQGAWSGGHCVAGAAFPSNYWCLAEGLTSRSFHEYICISNPGKEVAVVNVRPLFGGGPGSYYEIAAGQRFTIALESEELVERAYSITSDRGVVVERAMYFDYMGPAGSGWSGGHCTMGATLKDIY